MLKSEIKNVLNVFSLGNAENFFPKEQAQGETSNVFFHFPFKCPLNIHFITQFVKT